MPKKYGENVPVCPSRSIRAPLLDEFIWSVVMETLSNPVDFINRLETGNDIVIEKMELAINVVNANIKEKEKELEKVKIMFRREVIDADEMEDESRDIKRIINELKSKEIGYKEQITSIREKKMSEKALKLMLEKINFFIDNKGSELSFDEKRQVIESLINEVILRFEDDVINITTVGHLDRLVVSDSIHMNRGS